MFDLVEFVRNNILLILVAFVSGAMLMWPLVRRTTGGPWVSAQQATQMINRDDALLVDVRDPGEHGAGHIIGARSLPLARIQSAATELKRKDRALIVYCQGGERAPKAAAALRAQGFARVVNLSGGIAAWQQAGLPVEK
jgi:rhodanese-related sulfurtransferase